MIPMITSIQIRGPQGAETAERTNIFGGGPTLQNPVSVTSIQILTQTRHLVDALSLNNYRGALERICEIPSWW